MLTSTQLPTASTGDWLFRFLRQYSSMVGFHLVLVGLHLCSLLVHSPPAFYLLKFCWHPSCDVISSPISLFLINFLIISYSLMVLSGRLWEGAEIKCVQSATPPRGHEHSPIHQTYTSITVSGDCVVSPYGNGSPQRTYGHICFGLSQCRVRWDIPGN